MTALLTYAIAAERLAISERQLREFVAQGKIGFVNVGLHTRPSYRFRELDVDAFAAKHFRHKDGNLVFIPEDHASQQFERAREAILNGHEPAEQTPLPNDAMRRLRQDVLASLRASLVRAEVRAAKKGVPFSLTLEWALATVERQSFQCVLTCIPFYAKRAGASFAHPFAPSFDRIEPKLGYVPTNVRIVVVAINAALGEWGVEVFEQIALGYAAQKRRQT